MHSPTLHSFEQVAQFLNEALNSKPVPEFENRQPISEVPRVPASLIASRVAERANLIQLFSPIAKLNSEIAKAVESNSSELIQHS